MKGVKVGDKVLVLTRGGYSVDIINPGDTYEVTNMKSSMKIVFYITKLDGAEWGDLGEDEIISKVLHDGALKPNGRDGGLIRDSNGDTVGRWIVDPKTP